MCILRLEYDCKTKNGSKILEYYISKASSLYNFPPKCSKSPFNVVLMLSRVDHLNISISWFQLENMIHFSDLSPQVINKRAVDTACLKTSLL